MMSPRSTPAPLEGPSSVNWKPSPASLGVEKVKSIALVFLDPYRSFDTLLPKMSWLSITRIQSGKNVDEMTDDVVATDCTMRFPPENGNAVRSVARPVRVFVDSPPVYTTVCHVPVSSLILTDLPETVSKNLCCPNVSAPWQVTVPAVMAASLATAPLHVFMSAVPSTHAIWSIFCVSSQYVSNEGAVAAPSPVTSCSQLPAMRASILASTERL